MNLTVRRGGAAPLLAALAVLIAVSLAGCGGDAAPPPAAPPPTDAGVAADPTTAAEPEVPAASGPDACALVTQREAEELAGTKLADPVPVRETCTYSAPAGGPTAQVEVFVGDGAKKFLDIERDLDHELRPVAGAGDEAYASHEAVFVNRAGVWVAVRLVRLNDPAENRAPLEKVARTVAGRL